MRALPGDALSTYRTGFGAVNLISTTTKAAKLKLGDTFTQLRELLFTRLYSLSNVLPSITLSLDCICVPCECHFHLRRRRASGIAQFCRDLILRVCVCECVRYVRKTVNHAHMGTTSPRVKTFV